MARAARRNEPIPRSPLAAGLPRLVPLRLRDDIPPSRARNRAPTRNIDRADIRGRYWSAHAGSIASPCVQRFISIDRLYGGESTLRVGFWVLDYLRRFLWSERKLLCAKGRRTVLVPERPSLRRAIAE